VKQRVGLVRNIKYAALQGLYWMIACVSIVFASVFLLARGYTNAEIGTVMAAGYIVGMLLQPLVSAAADRARRLNATAVLALAGLATAAAVCGLVVFPARSAALTVSYVLFMAFQLVLQPLVNAYCFFLETPETPILFGIARGVGSLCWGIMSAVLGLLCDRYGTGVLAPAALILIAALMALLFLCRHEGTARAPMPVAEHASGRTSFALSRCFLFLLLGNTFLFFGHAMIDNFPYQVITNVGGTSAQMGVFCAYAAMLEIPALFLFDRIRKRFSCEQLLRFGAFFFLVKSVALWLVRTLAGVYLANAFQAISFALFVPAAVRYAGETAGNRSANSAQSLVTATTSAGNILSCVLGGLLIDNAGVSGMLAVGAAASVVGASFVLFGVREKKPET